MAFFFQLLPSFRSSMKTLPKILICDKIRWAQDDIPTLFDGIAQVVTMDDTPDLVEFLARFQPGGPYEGTVGWYQANVVLTHPWIFDRELIAGLPPSMKWIALCGVGYDLVDLDACKEKGIRVSNTPSVSDDTTATTALYLVLSTLRHFSKAERILRTGRWGYDIDATGTHDLTGRTLGILGMGGIGLRLAHLVHAFPMRVVYHNRHRRTDVPDWCVYVDSVEALCKEADVLSLHVPLNKETEGLVGEKEIRTMKRGSVIINTARGKVLDEEAVIRALEDGQLGAVGLDVYPDEPRVDPRLFTFPQSVLLPHVGNRSQDAEKKMEIRALTSLRDFLMTGSGEDLVPEMK